MPTMSIEKNNNFYFISSQKGAVHKKEIYRKNISAQKYARKPKEPADLLLYIWPQKWNVPECDECV